MASVDWSRFSEEFLALYGPPFGPKATADKYRQVMAEFAAIGVKKTKDLTDQSVVKWIRTHQDRKPITNANLLKHLRAAANVATKKGYLKVSPFTIRPVSKWIPVNRLQAIEELEREEQGTAQTARHLSMEEIRRLLAHLAGRTESRMHRTLYVLTALIAYTGVRKSEALRAKIKDFDLARRTFRIRVGKTAASSASIPLAPALATILDSYFSSMEGSWAFPGPWKVGPWTGGSPGTKALDKLKTEADRIGIPGCTFLRLRHSWATHAEAWGLSELEIMRILRHTTTNTSKRWYRHDDEANLQTAANKIGFDG